MTAPLSRVEAIARREADATGRPHVVLNLNRAGAPLYVCREMRDGIEADRIVSRFDPAPSAPVVEPVASVVGEAAPAGPVYHPLTVRALRIYQDAAKARFTRIPDADADEDYTSGAEWAASEGLRDPVDRLRAYTRERCGELLAKARALRAKMRCGNWQGDNNPLDLAAVQEALLQRREDRRALVAAKARAGAPAPAMVPQPVQQQQARARGRAPQPARGERRYVTVRDTETGDVHRVLTSVARVGVAVVIFIPSNRHRQGALGGMLITHDDIRKAWVFNDVAEARRMLSRNRAPGERVIRAELVADPAPAIVPLGGRYVALADGGVEWVADAPTMVPQPAQQQQAKARAAVAAPSDKAVTWTEFWACYAQCATRQYEAGTLPYPRMAPVGMSHSEAGTWLADMASRTVSSGQPFAHDGPVLRAALRSFGQAARTKRDTLAFLAGLVR
ncbi:hypothetical protein ABEV34_04775 [Methylorubrum rhodesianum]|uniref:hypothetical protein n=1 Tax=Methylorubrum rhodesianum TaxID=29427 RepID=UPI003D2AF2E8